MRRRALPYLLVLLAIVLATSLFLHFKYPRTGERRWLRPFTMRRVMIETHHFLFPPRPPPLGPPPANWLDPMDPNFIQHIWELERVRRQVQFKLLDPCEIMSSYCRFRQTNASVKAQPAQGR